MALLVTIYNNVINGQWSSSTPPTVASHPDLSLPASIGSISSAAAASAQATVLSGWQVLVHGTTVRDEAQAQLEVSGKTTVCSQRQDQ